MKTAPTLLCLTSTLPRWRGDTEPAFVHELNRRLSEQFRILALAPHAPGAATRETLEGVEIRRFRYAWAAAEALAYEGGIVAKLRARPLLWLLVPAFVVAQVVAAWRILRREPVAAVHAHWLIPQALCAQVARRLGGRHVPVVCTVHGADLFAFNHPWLRWLQRTLANRCERVAAVSEAVRAELVARGVDAHRIRVLPMGVPVPAEATPPRGDGDHLVFAGRLVGKKGVDVLLRAFREIRAARPRVRLTIAGGGPERARHEGLAGELGVAPAVAFTGPAPHEDVLALLRDATVVVVPSVVAEGGDTEGLGLVAIEAMAAGSPVVASDLPAIRGFIDDGATGLLFPAGDAGALARAVVRLLDDGALRARLGAAARRRAVAEFGWPVAAARYAREFAALAAS